MDYLWQDRRRIFGLPITFTRYAMSEDRLFVETGLVNLHAEEVLLYRVRDISLSIHLGQRIFGVGSVTVVSADRTAPTLVLRDIRNPREVKELLHQQVEEAKTRRKLRLGEMMHDVPADAGDDWEDGDAF